MKILLVGATGRLGVAVGKALTGRGHQVVTLGRTGGDIRADVADPEETARVFAQVGDLDAVAGAAGDVPYKRVVEGMMAGFTQTKQINLRLGHGARPAPTTGT